MKKILHVSASPRGKAAESYRLSLEIIAALRQRSPALEVIDRPVGNGGPPHVDEDYAISQASVKDISDAGSMAHSEELVCELESADCLLISTPMHNLSLPSALKAWVDHVVRARRTFSIGPGGKVGLLEDRPVFIAIASGGRFSGDQARQPDFLTPYQKTILAMIGLKDVIFFTVQGTGPGGEALLRARDAADRELAAHFAEHDEVAARGKQHAG
jgi:FMN-dependent NADH-azoreductase